MLATQVEAAYGADAVSRALERAYAAIVRQHRTRGAVPDSSETLRAAVRRPFKVSPLIYIVFPSGIGQSPTYVENINTSEDWSSEELLTH